MRSSVISTRPRPVRMSLEGSSLAANGFKICLTLAGLRLGAALTEGLENTPGIPIPVGGTVTGLTKLGFRRHWSIICRAPPLTTLPERKTSRIIRSCCSISTCRSSRGDYLTQACKWSRAFVEQPNTQMLRSGSDVQLLRPPPPGIRLIDCPRLRRSNSEPRTALRSATDPYRARRRGRQRRRPHFPAMRWGLASPASSDIKTGLTLFNARAESASGRAMAVTARSVHRCDGLIKAQFIGHRRITSIFERGFKALVLARTPAAPFGPTPGAPGILSEGCLCAAQADCRARKSARKEPSACVHRSSRG